MAQQGELQIPIQPEDPEYEVEQHIKYRRRQQIQASTLSKLIAENLSDFKPIMNGTAYAYTTLKIRNAGINQLADFIKEYQHLRKIDLGMNLLKEIPLLLNLKYVTHLDLSRNLLTSASFLSKDGVFPYLKQLNLMGNKIDALPIIVTRSLRKLNLNNNLITSLQDFDGHPTLELIQLRGNKIKSLKGIKNMPSLKELYIAQNELTSFKELDKVDQLMKIHARKNRISNLSDFPNIPRLVYLNLRENQIGKVDDLRGVSESIKNINLLANPVETELGENTKKQVWMKFRNFSRINKNQVTAEEREQFDKEYKDRLAEQERERLEKEAAERQARQQQEAQNKD